MSFLGEMKILPMKQKESRLKKKKKEQSENVLGNTNMTTEIKHSKH